MIFRNFLSSLRMGIRMIKAAALRPVRALIFQIRRSTNMGRQVSKVVPAVSKMATNMKLKPETRADYIDAGQVYIAKSLFVVVGLVLVLGGLFVYYICLLYTSRCV